MRKKRQISKIKKRQISKIKKRANEQYDDVVFRATRSWGALSDV